MKIIIPKSCKITEKATLELKNAVKYLITKFEEKYSKEFQIFLYKNSLKVIHKKKQYVVAMVVYNEEYFWYVKPFLKSYLLLKNTDKSCLDLVLTMIKTIS